MEILKFSAGSREVFLHKAASENCPLVVFNNYSGDGSGIVKKLNEMNCRAVNFLSVSVSEWNRDLSPWKCPPIYPDEDFSGGADEYLGLLVSEIIPKAESMICGEPSRLCIAGYSLAGLFALYAMYRCDIFDCAASMSGSLWFPGFREYVLENSFEKVPDKIYISLGDKEDRAKNPILKTVRENTDFIAGHYRNLGIDVTYEMNPGNHFRDEETRSAKGIAAVLNEK